MSKSKNEKEINLHNIARFLIYGFYEAGCLRKVYMFCYHKAEIKHFIKLYWEVKFSIEECFSENGLTNEMQINLIQCIRAFYKADTDARSAGHTISFGLISTIVALFAVACGLIAIFTVVDLLDIAFGLIDTVYIVMIIVLIAGFRWLAVSIYNQKRSSVIVSALDDMLNNLKQAEINEQKPKDSYEKNWEGWQRQLGGMIRKSSHGR